MFPERSETRIAVRRNAQIGRRRGTFLPLSNRALLDGDVVRTGTGMSDDAKKSRFNSGFIWGCLTPLLVVALLIVAGLVYVGQYLVSGYKNDETLNMVIATVQGNSAARDMLGDNIQLDGFPSFKVNYDANTGHTAEYEFTAKGSKASGTVKAALKFEGKTPHFTELTLTGPDGVKHDLLNNPARGAFGEQTMLVRRPLRLAAAHF